MPPDSAPAREQQQQLLPPTPAPARLEVVSIVEPPFFRRPEFLLRVGVVQLLVLAAFGLLGLRLWSLQVLQGERYASAARVQSSRVLVSPAPRGAIFDARGRLLAGTEGRLAIVAEAAALGRLGPEGDWSASPSGRRELARLAHVAGVPAARLAARIRAATLAQPYAPVALIRSAPRTLAFFLVEHAEAFPGVRVEVAPRRSYPQGALGSEVLGLVGEISAEQLQKRSYRGYRPGQLVGRSGVEAAYDRYLNGGFVRARVPVDAFGRSVAAPTTLGPTRRPLALRLTLDARIQRSAERAIRLGIERARATGHPDANAGAAVVMNARTGGLYALATYPGFSQVAAARAPRYLARLLGGRDPRRPLLDRATQGVYPPGSTFKPVVAAAALASGVLAPSAVLPCTGSLQVGNTVFHNVEPGVNALLTLPQALSISCDTWFYRVGLAFDARRRAGAGPLLQRWARRLGLGRPTGLDLPGEAAGLVPTPAWLRQTFRQPWRRVWYTGYSVNLAIGQGQLLVTPLQLAVAYAALANGGTVVRPHLGDALLSPSHRVVRTLRFPPHARLRLPGPEAIRGGLYAAAHEGTSAAVFADFPVPVAGKTGTAEVPGGSDHSWYASWAPVDHPRVVVVVLIEHGGFGAEAAAPAAREIYQAFFRLGKGGEVSDRDR